MILHVYTLYIVIYKINSWNIIKIMFKQYVKLNMELKYEILPRAIGRCHIFKFIIYWVVVIIICVIRSHKFSFRSFSFSVISTINEDGRDSKCQKENYDDGNGYCYCFSSILTYHEIEIESQEEK